MAHSHVWEWFRLYFPLYEQHVEAWFPNGHNSIRVRQTNKQEFVFTYNDEKDWRFETVDSFINGIKRRKEVK